MGVLISNGSRLPAFLLCYDAYTLSSRELLLLRPSLEVEEARLSRITVCRATY